MILQYVLAKKQGLLEHVYVMGCLSERYRDSLKREIPEVDAFFGVNDLEKIVRHIGGTYRKILVGERKLATPSHYAYLKIAEGCDRKCSFCAIPGIRGLHQSRPMEEIVKEAEWLARNGTSEINLISQDSTYYGLDLYKKRRLAELLEKLAAISGLQWIRLHYTYPDGFPVEVLDVIRSFQNLCKYIDMPVQHISDRILKSMRRGIGGNETRKLIDTIRDAVPGVALRTTLIAGYPGETHREFSEMVRFIEETRFDRLGVFPYSHEEGTGAYRLKDSVPARVKTERVGELMSVQEGISLALNREKIGRSIRVVVDRQEGEYFVARSEHDSPEVDNEVLIKCNAALAPGNFCMVRIVSADSFDLFAELQ
jgi:ribosomal protein S12 methylthiotransferase